MCHAHAVVRPETDFVGAAAAKTLEQTMMERTRDAARYENSTHSRNNPGLKSGYSFAGAERQSGTIAKGDRRAAEQLGKRSGVTETMTHVAGAKPADDLR